MFDVGRVGCDDALDSARAKRCVGWDWGENLGDPVEVAMTVG